MRKFIFIVLFFVLGQLKVTAQHNVNEFDSLFNGVLERNLEKNISKFRDSSKLFVFAIKINTTRINKDSVRLDSVTSNDPSGSKLLFGDLEELKGLKLNNSQGKTSKLKMIKPISIQIGEKVLQSVTFSDLQRQHIKLLFLGGWPSSGDFNHQLLVLSPFFRSIDLRLYD